jgi:cysteine desulfurase
VSGPSTPFERIAAAPVDWSASQWREHLRRAREHLMPALPERLASMLGGSAALLEGYLARGSMPNQEAERHLAFEDGCVRLLGVHIGACGGPSIYLDNNASTRVDPRVVGPMVDAMTIDYGNAHSADHVFGGRAKARGEHARGQLATLLGVATSAVHFTSGATESIRVGLDHALGQIVRRRGRRARVVAMPAEHRATLSALERAQKTGVAEVGWMTLDERGGLRADTLVAELGRGVDLIVCMGANNETGAIYPIDVLCGLAHRLGAWMFVDGTQWIGKVPVDLGALGVDVCAMSAHKMYGPKGVGALALQGAAAEGFDGVAGTPATPAIVGLGVAAELARRDLDADRSHCARLRDRLATALLGSPYGIVRNGDPARCLPGTLHVSVPGLQSEILLAALRDHVALSTGAACASAKGAASHVLEAMRLPDWRRRGAVRIGVGRFTTDEEIDRASQQILGAIEALQARWVEV